MEFYILLFVLISICMFFSCFFRKAGYLIFFGLFVILATRASSVGTDTMNYLEHFTTGYAYGDDFTVKHLEIAYVYLVKLLVFFNMGAYSITFSIAFLTFVFIYISVWKLKLDMGFFMSFFVLTGFYLFSFNGSRQILAVTVALIGYVDFIKYESTNDRWRLVLFMVLACMFHNSMLVVLPIVFVPRKRISDLFFNTLLVISILSFWTEFNPLIGQFRVILESTFSSYEDLMSESSSTSFNAKIFYMLILVCQLSMLFLTRKKYEGKLVNLFMISIIVFLLLKNMHPYLSRLLYASSIIQVVYYTKFATDKSYSLLYRSLIIAPLVILLLYSQYDVLSSNIGEIIPYSSNL